MIGAQSVAARPPGQPALALEQHPDLNPFVLIGDSIPKVKINSFAR